MVAESDNIIIKLTDNQSLEQAISAIQPDSAKKITITGSIDDEDVVLLGKYIRSHKNINIVDLSEVEGITSIDHNSFEQCESIREFYLPTHINRIGDHAFDGCSELKELLLPNTIEIIGDRAFSGCKVLSKINIPQKVSYIGVGCFYECYKLTEFKVDSQNERYAFRGGVLFDNVDKTLLRYIPSKEFQKEFKTPSGVVHIGNYAFDGCEGLVSVIVSEGCTDLGERSFTRCHDLISINLPSTVNNLDYNAFDDCDALEAITVDKQNNTYKSQNGVLYDYSMKTLEICPKSRKSPFFFPNTIEAINEGAFSGCKNIRTVILPQGIKSIGANAFSNCEHLFYLNIPNSLESIGDFAFSNCNKLARIYVFKNNPPKCGVSPFASTDFKNCTVFVPIDSEISFRKDYGWDSFVNIKEGFKLSMGASLSITRSIRLAFKRFFITHFSKQ